MLVEALVFTFTMSMIARELHLAFRLPFWLTWLTTAAGEFVVMIVDAPLKL
ncbi:hypothetical protein [Peribacillus glennii]|uniref:hypothetical protein n=1 Tax=Peribacillus glennii TaxID=2303991 RepID=UPI003899D1E5